MIICWKILDRSIWSPKFFCIRSIQKMLALKDLWLQQKLNNSSFSGLFFPYEATKAKKIRPDVFNFIKKSFITGIFQWILQNFRKQLSYRTPVNDCFCFYLYYWWGRWRRKSSPYNFPIFKVFVFFTLFLWTMSSTYPKILRFYFLQNASWKLLF